MNLRDFIAQWRLVAGEYLVGTPSATALETICQFSLDADDEENSRHVPKLSLPGEMSSQNKRLVSSAIVRAGARHPGLRLQDLAQLHRVALREGQVELFTDLNALTTGLLQHLVRSLGRRVVRVVLSSTAIDVLHEYQSHYSVGTRLKRAEMVRALRVLDEVRRTVPVHIHQLPPGATRYFSRGNAQPEGAELIEAGDEESLFISEDRQMMSAFWHYQTISNPRLPVFLVTSDFSLATVCAAERAPFIFAQTPFEYWRRSQQSPAFDLLWFDSFALALNFCIPHAVLWEFSLIYGEIRILRLRPSPREELALYYDHRSQLPGQQEDIRIDFSPKPWVHTPTSTRDSGVKPPKSTTLVVPSKDRKIKLSLGPIIEVLPTRKGQRIPLQSFRARDEDSLRQLRQLGQATDLYRVEHDEVISGPSLDSLLASLEQGDYIGVNGTFRRHPTYDKVLTTAEQQGRFPSSKVIGAATGWAVLLGAAYKTKTGVLYGLASVSDEKFEETVVRFHREIGDGQRAVSLPRILDRTCLALRLSPIRFEGLLARSLGRGALNNFEVQRASIDIDLPAHPVLVYPMSALPESYIRQIEPGRGLVIKGVLVSSLVRRSGRA